ncbi:MAG: hypothetical protein ACOX4J_04460 [Anaerovoracaceae bacterium]
MAATKEAALQEAKRILSYIESTELTDDEKAQITKTQSKTSTTT